MAPLDWGLGHATRCIPIISALINNGFTVFLAAEGAQAHLLQTEFPTLTLLPLKGYRVRYSKNKWGLPFVLLLQLPRILRSIRQEHSWLDHTIREQGIDLVISDNRYGLYSKKVSCIFLTHQLNIKAPYAWMEALLRRIHYHFINRFSKCWVPDGEGVEGIAGILSHPTVLPKIPVRYIGLPARFRGATDTENFLYDYCILLSGPEPQRTLLEQKCMEAARHLPASFIVVRGRPGDEQVPLVAPHITVCNHLPGKELEKVLQQSRCVVSRSGYTTVMELLAMHKKALLIPTPGQTEQEYLAEQLQQKGSCISVSQEAFDGILHLPQLAAFQPRPVSFSLFNPEFLNQWISES